MKRRLDEIAALDCTVNCLVDMWVFEHTGHCKWEFLECIPTPVLRKLLVGHTADTTAKRELENSKTKFDEQIVQSIELEFNY